MPAPTLRLVLCALLIAGCAGRAGAQPGASSMATIENIGSDTMVNLALAWAEVYQQQHPDLRISVTGGGSGTGIAALLNGTADIANASRAMKSEEKQAAEADGTQPFEIEIARDAIAVIVHVDNPVGSLTLQQISDIYSGKLTNWREVGGEDRPIVRLSRETNSGTHVYFLEEVIRLGDKDNKTLFSPDTLLLPSSEGITAEIRQNRNAIGYDGLGYVTPDVKTIAVAAEPGAAYVLPSVESVNAGTYPIARPLFMYTRGEPAGPIREYLDWIAGSAGQAIVAQLGFVPLQ